MYRCGGYMYYYGGYYMYRCGRHYTGCVPKVMKYIFFKKIY